MEASPERIEFHGFIEKFKSYLTPNSLVYDIGKSTTWDYKDTFKNYQYHTIDRNEELNPDFVVDVENYFPSFTLFKESLKPCDGIVCNGVIEQCNNPFKLIKGVKGILKKGGYLLLGSISIGFPLYANDYIRFTPRGIERLVADFTIFKKKICFRNEQPSYMFLILKK